VNSMAIFVWGMLVGDMLSELEALDFIGAILAPYLDTFGPLTWGFFTLIVLLPLHSRLGTLALVALALFMWTPLVMVLPDSALKIGYLLLKISLGVGLGALFIGVYRRYG